jgi:hypothetical protein
VVRYSYLWATEYEKGNEEGRKDRPCAIVVARQLVADRAIVTVVPVTHVPPRDANDAVEIPAAVKVHLGLDDLPSWIVVTETNDFLWPGPDLRPLPSATPRRYDYGMLPPRFFIHVRNKILGAHRSRRLNRVQRTD